MARLRLSMGKTIIIAALALMLIACATQKLKTTPQSEYLPDTVQGMACEEFVRYPIATRGVWRGYFPMLTGLWSDCFETGAPWMDSNTFLYAPFICPFYPAYPIFGVLYFGAASIGLMPTVDLMLVFFHKKCPPHQNGPQQLTPNPAIHKNP
jgi:hypothetical protein